MDPLETERLTLRPSHPGLFEGCWRAVENSFNELRVWMPWAIDPDPKETLEFLRKAEQEWEEGLERHFTLFYDSEACGQCSLDRPDPLNSAYEMGYWLRSDLTGRGLMTEAADAVVGFAFNTIATHRIELRAGTENRPSIRVAEKLGFQREGIAREGARGADGFYDAYLYGLLRADYRPLAR